MFLQIMLKRILVTVFTLQVSTVAGVSGIYADDATTSIGELSARLDDLESQLNGRAVKVDDDNPGAQVTPEDLDRLRDEIRHLKTSQVNFEEIGRMRQDIDDLKKEVARLSRNPAQKNLTSGNLSSHDQLSASSKEIDAETESVLKLLEEAAPEEDGGERLGKKRDGRNLEMQREMATQQAERRPPDPSASLPVGNAQAQYNEACHLYEKGAYPEAERAFDYFITTYPKNTLVPQAQFGKANASLKQGKYRQAKTLYVNVYRKNPKGPKAPECLLKLGEAFALDGKPENACITWKKLSDDYPSLNAQMKKEVAVLKKKNGCG